MLRPTAGCWILGVQHSSHRLPMLLVLNSKPWCWCTEAPCSGLWLTHQVKDISVSCLCCLFSQLLFLWKLPSSSIQTISVSPHPHYTLKLISLWNTSRHPLCSESDLLLHILLVSYMPMCFYITSCPSIVLKWSFWCHENTVGVL